MLLISEEFKAALDGCPQEIRNRTLTAVQLLRIDPGHPSLQAHRIRNAPGKWECYVNQGWRIIYDWKQEELRLWKLGDHRLIDRVHQQVFSPHTSFSRWVEETEPDEAEEETAAGADDYQYRYEPAGGKTENPFAFFPATHLRVLGVPPQLVKKVQRTPYLEDLEKIDGLPPQSLSWMQDLATDCRMEYVFYDPDRLLFRTTLDRLQGYCRGSLKRLMLNLDPEQTRYVESRRTDEFILRGCAGSGKTTVGVYRAIEQAAKGRRVLLLTYTRTLNGVNKTLIEELIGPLPENLEVKTFFNWLTDYLREEHDLHFNIIDGNQQKEILQNALQQAQKTLGPAFPNLDPIFIHTEIQQVIKGNGIDDLEEYLQVQRFGRNTPLLPRYRRAVWAVYNHYQELLKEEDLSDWNDIPLVGLKKITTNPLAKPYDDVILDEGQDLSPIQLRLTRALIRGSAPHSHRTYMVLADASQTIYNRGFSWKEAGIQARGRTSILRKNHRNTVQIATAATELIKHNKLLKIEQEFIKPTWSHRLGARPRVVICDRKEREVRFVCEEMLDLIGGGHFRLADFAILCPTNKKCRLYQDELTRRNIPCIIHKHEAFNILQEKVKIMTIHSAKGIEFPVVFVIGVRRGYFPRYINRYGLDKEEILLDQERFRTLLYVGMTRAAENLFLVTTAGSESPFLGEIADLVDHEECCG